MHMPRSNTVSVREALPKLKFLASDRDASDRGGYRAGWSGFARRIMQVRVERGLDERESPNFRNTLSSAAANDKIDADTEEIVADLCRFDRNGRAWRTGTKKQFQDEYQGSQYDVSRPDSCWSIHDMISVQAFFPQGGMPTQWPFDLEIVCGKARLPEIGITVAISRVVVRVTWDVQLFPGTHASRARDRSTKLQAQIAGLSELNVGVTVFGRDTAPGWELSNAKGCHLGVISLDTICELFGVADGLEVEATLTIYDKDLNAEVSASPISQETSLDADIEPDAIGRADGASLGITKIRVLQAIAARSLKDHSEQPAGSAILATDRLRFRTR